MSTAVAPVEPPSTPHLAWLGKGRAREKVLPPGVVRALLARPVVVEERPDGALIAIDFPDLEDPRVQRLGQPLTHGAHPQFHPLWAWISDRQAELARVLGRERVLFAEWCYATHAHQHDRLPDWLIVTDIYDRREARCLSTDRRDQITRQLELATPPELMRMKVDLQTLVARLGDTPSRLGQGLVAGLVVRLEQDGHLVERAQLVSAPVADAPGDPGTHKTLQRNALASPT